VTEQSRKSEKVSCFSFSKNQREKIQKRRKNNRKNEVISVNYNFTAEERNLLATFDMGDRTATLQMCWDTAT
jgi:hypothetical protein